MKNKILYFFLSSLLILVVQNANAAPTPEQIAIWAARFPIKPTPKPMPPIPTPAPRIEPVEVPTPAPTESPTPESSPGGE